jgi:DNA repair exonuclease SbcCD ATPase subunit
VEEKQVAAETETSEVTEESTESETEEQQESAEAVSEEKPKKGDRLQKRFDQLTSKIKDLEAKLAEKPVEAKTEVAKSTGSDKPKLENFDSLEDFQEALTDWKLDQREKQAETKRAEESAKKEAGQRAKTFKERIEAAQSKYSDFDEVVLENSVQPTVAMVDAMLDSELGAEIAYHLGQNTAEIKRISGLSPARQAVEIGKLEAALEAKTTPKKVVAKAPPPPKPLGGRAQASIGDIGKMPLSQYRALREAGKL